MKNEESAPAKGSSLECARQVVETVPMLMRLIRSAVTEKGSKLSLPQMRMMAFLSRHPGASISEVATYLDVTIPTTSTLVDRLVRKNLVHRRDDPSERRKVNLTITPEGQRLLDHERTKAQQFVANLLSMETPEQLDKIGEGLELLEKAAQAQKDLKK
jgi:DNA-binding MarR family transcriptional regulator